VSIAERDKTIEWVRLDVWGSPTGETYRGSVEALMVHLRHGLEDVAGYPEVHDSEIYVHPLGRVVCTVVTVTTPWGSYRWIPKPPKPAPAPRRFLWL
jgi:hypothetical protein